jgi:hypothetical protein
VAAVATGGQPHGFVLFEKNPMREAIVFSLDYCLIACCCAMERMAAATKRVAVIISATICTQTAERRNFAGC